MTDRFPALLTALAALDMPPGDPRREALEPIAQDLCLLGVRILQAAAANDTANHGRLLKRQQQLNRQGLDLLNRLS